MFGPARKGIDGAPGRGEEGDTKPIDRAYLTRFTLGNVELEEEVLSLFTSQAPLYLEKLGAAADRKAWKEAAHTIKGSAAAIGARHVARCAELAEKIDIEADVVRQEGHRERAIVAIATAIDEVRAHIDQLLTAR